MKRKPEPVWLLMAPNGGYYGNIYRSRKEAERWCPWWRAHGYECEIVHFVPSPPPKRRKRGKR